MRTMTIIYLPCIDWIHSRNLNMKRMEQQITNNNELVYRLRMVPDCFALHEYAISYIKRMA